MGTSNGSSYIQYSDSIKLRKRFLAEDDNHHSTLWYPECSTKYRSSTIRMVASDFRYSDSCFQSGSFYLVQSYQTMTTGLSKFCSFILLKKRQHLRLMAGSASWQMKNCMAISNIPLKFLTEIPRQ